MSSADEKFYGFSKDEIIALAAQLDNLSSLLGPSVGGTLKKASDLMLLMSSKIFENIVGDAKYEFGEVQDDLDMVNNPPHYNVHAMECFCEMVEVFGLEAVIAYCKCAAWKYRYRAQYKGNPEQDNEKADWYLLKLKELNGNVDN